jgi:6-phosphofructokinase 1
MVLKGACLFGQSGGPTAVINASAAGVFLTALKSENITEVYGALNGISGVINDNIIDISKEDIEELNRLKYTPAAALGSIRYKLRHYKDDDTDYKKILDVFKKYNIRYFFYCGGNDSMDTCHKISGYMQEQKYDCRIIGIPKTIDNDLMGIDHCPGYGSAAKYIATTLLEVILDATSYTKSRVTIIETMGRHTGWLAAASCLANRAGVGPDLIYIPEIPFDVDQFIEDTARLYRENKRVIVVVSEGIVDKYGNFVLEKSENVEVDNFGHVHLGGVGYRLANEVKRRLELQTRVMELNLAQRCAGHIASKVDAEEAFTLGKKAVEFALRGDSDSMIVLNRVKTNYKVEYGLYPLSQVANLERKMPREWMNEKGNNVMPQFIDYVLPLIKGENKVEYEKGLPRYCKLKKVKAEVGVNVGKENE